MAGEPGQARLWLLLGLLVLVLALPFAILDLPPLADLPDHAARYYLLTHTVPGVAGHYAVNIRPLPNLLGDLIVIGLAPVVGFRAAVSLLLVLAAVLPVVGCFCLHRALFGRAHWWPLLSGLFAFNTLFLMGFVNFSLGLGIAFGVAAVWVALSPRRPGLATLLFAPLALLAALAHAFGFLFLAILIGGYEIERAWDRRGTPRAALLGVVRRGLGLGLATLPALWLTAQSVVASADRSQADWGSLEERIASLLAPFAAYHQRADFATAVLVVGLVLALLLLRRLQVRPMALVGLVAATALFFALPLHTDFGPAVVSPRFPVFAAFLLCAAAQPDLAGWPRRLAQAGIAALIMAKLAIIGMVWQSWKPQLAQVRHVLEAVTPGARIGTVTVARTEATNRYFNDQIPRAMLSFSYFRPDGHLGALAVLDRGAVWPSLFAYTGQQPIVRIGPFAAHPLVMEPLPPRGILQADRAPVEWRPAVPAHKRAEAEAAWKDWRDQFDYVLVLHGQAASDHDRFLPDRLELVRRDGFAVLYRVRPR